jgi:hypothetical protein
MMMEKFVEWLARETEVLGENLPQCRFVHHKSHMALTLTLPPYNEKYLGMNKRMEYQKSTSILARRVNSRGSRTYW